EKTPESVRLWLLLGETWVHELNFPEARTAFERALELDPGEPEAMLGLARAFYHQQLWSDAAVRTQSVLDAHPSFAPGHVLMARILAAENSIDKATFHYELAKSLSKSSTDRQLEAALGIQPAKIVLESVSAEEGDEGFVAPSPGWEEDGEIESFEPIPEFEEDNFSPFHIGKDLDDGDDGGDQFDVLEWERPDGKFADVAGLEEVKEELKMKLIYPFLHPDWFRAYGKKAGGGVVLHGPPGCGKSMVARAVAGETEAAFFNVRLHEILEEYAGCTEKNLHSIFHQARELAPSVIFIDELDAIANRENMKYTPARAAVNQLLIELDGYDAPGGNEGVLVIGATNSLQDIDLAFLRPGRFCRKIFVSPPDEVARQQLLKLHACSRPVDVVDFELLANEMVDFTGADIAQVYELAGDDALRLAMRSGEIVPLNTELLLNAAKRIKPTVALWRERHGDPESS
ncbi:MAG: AAA family ATPase, partial [Verrucomicrobiota bacterium]